MTKKYIIKNCPARNNGYFKDCVGTYHNECQDCTDCLLKQIVEKCYEKVSLCKECSKDAIFDIDCINCTDGGKRQIAEEILEWIIQECE